LSGLSLALIGNASADESRGEGLCPSRGVFIHAAYDDHANVYITKPESSEALTTIVETIERFWIAIAQLPKVVRRSSDTRPTTVIGSYPRTK
jgi:hypothetical protein